VEKEHTYYHSFSSCRSQFLRLQFDAGLTSLVK